jgi:hypothetical protein
LVWYDDRDARESPASPTPAAKAMPLEVEVRFGFSVDGGRSWSQIRVAGPFDLHSAHLSQDGDFVGDYVGFVGLPQGFAALYPMAKPVSVAGATDLFFSRMRPEPIGLT